MHNCSFNFVYNSLACFLAILIVLFMINMNYDYGSEQTIASLVDNEFVFKSDLSELALEENQTGAFYDQKILNEIFLRQNVERRALLHISTHELTTANFIYAAVRKDWESIMCP